jgi:hypothetical protein
MEPRQQESKVDRAKETLNRAKDGVVAGAAQVKEKAAEVATTAKEQAERVARVVREAEPDAELREDVLRGTEQRVARAGEAVTGAAPAIGRGAELAAEKVGSALKFVAHPLAVVVGTIAGVVGGWWKKASELRADMPAAEEEACRAHFQALGLSPEAITFERARTGYALGYLAASNPDYLGRVFDDVETDLRLGFTEPAVEYDSLRDFARYGYERGSGGNFLGGGNAQTNDNAVSGGPEL